MLKDGGVDYRGRPIADKSGPVAFSDLLQRTVKIYQNSPIVKTSFVKAQKVFKLSTVSNYIDGIGNISLIDGVVRLDLMTLSRGAPDKSQAVISGHLCMSTRAFLRTYQQMTDALADLEKQGVIKRREERAEGKSSAPEKAAAKTGASNKK